MSNNGGFLRLTSGHWCFGKRPPVCGIRLQRRLATGAVFSTTGRERRSRSDSVAFVDTVGGLIFVVVFGSSGHRVMVFPSSFCRDKLPGFGNHSGHLAGLLFRPIRVIGRGCCFASFGSSVGLCHCSFYLVVSPRSFNCRITCPAVRQGKGPLSFWDWVSCACSCAMLTVPGRPLIVDCQT